MADLVSATVRICGALREEGVPVTVAEARDAARALEVVDLGDRGEVRLALRTVLATDPGDYETFDRVFDELWGAPGETGPLAAPRPRAPSRARPRPDPLAPSRSRAGAVPSLRAWSAGGAGEDDAEPLGVPAMSPRESEGPRDLRALRSEGLEDVRRVAARIARRLARRRSRRWRPARRGRKVHLRRTFRGSLRTGGEMVDLVYRERKRRKAKLVVLCDVSGSMDLYSRFLLQFLYALQNAFARVETFVFSTGLDRITPSLREGSYEAALARLSEEVRGWSGGTRIGESLRAFRDGWIELVDRRTIVIVLSDGWDTGPPELLAEELAGLKRRAGRLIWLNPLLGHPDYEPRTRGMEAALPHVDVFAPAHDLASPEALARHLAL